MINDIYSNRHPTSMNVKKHSGGWVCSSCIAMPTSQTQPSASLVSPHRSTQQLQVLPELRLPALIPDSGTHKGPSCNTNDLVIQPPQPLSPLCAVQSFKIYCFLLSAFSDNTGADHPPPWTTESLAYVAFENLGELILYNLSERGRILLNIVWGIHYKD